MRLSVGCNTKLYLILLFVKYHVNHGIFITAQNQNTIFLHNV